MAVVGSFAKDVDRMRRRLPDYLTGEAKRASRITKREVRRLTPVGRVIDRDSGRDLGPHGVLKESVDAKQVVVLGPRRKNISRYQRGFSMRGTTTYVGGADTPIWYGSLVEEGTVPHVILPHAPHTHLRFVANGEIAYARRVNHPGTLGVHMFYRGLLEAERVWHVEADTRLQAFWDKQQRSR